MSTMIAFLLFTVVISQINLIQTRSYRAGYRSYSRIGRDGRRELNPRSSYGRLQPRIIGGKPATEAQLPYMLSLRVNGQHSCGAAYVISPTSGEQLIITSASCVTRSNTKIPLDVGQLSVYGGVTNLDSTDGHHIPIAKVHIHPDYDIEEHIIVKNDVALLSLGGRFNNLTRKVEPIELPSPDEGQSLRVTVAGWGKTAKDATVYSKDLQVVDLNLDETEECADAYKKVLGTDVVFEDVQFCAGGYGDAGTCEGDEGGPAVGFQRGNANPVLLGIFSWSLECQSIWSTDIKYPAIFSDMRKFVTWVESFC